MNWICPKIVMYLSACGDYTYNVLFGHHAGRKVPVIVTLMAWNDPGNTGRKRHRKRCRSLYLPGQRNSWILSTILTKKRRKWALKKGQELTSPFHSKKFDNAVLKYLCKLCLYGGAWRLVVTAAMFSVVYLFICWKVSFATFRVYEESTFNFFFYQVKDKRKDRSKHKEKKHRRKEVSIFVARLCSLYLWTLQQRVQECCHWQICPVEAKMAHSSSFWVVFLIVIRNSWVSGEWVVLQSLKVTIPVIVLTCLCCLLVELGPSETGAAVCDLLIPLMSTCYLYWLAVVCCFRLMWCDVLASIELCTEI